MTGIAIGIFKAAMKFFRGDPDKVEDMIGVIIAIAILKVGVKARQLNSLKY